MDVLPGLTTRVLGCHAQYLQEVDSTNNWLKDRAGQLPHGSVVLAASQHGGRGRQGKAWGDIPGAGLALSVLLHQELAPTDMTRLPLLTGLAVCLALEKLAGPGFSIKWSNDVLHHERKICGILCESRLQGAELFAILGIGVNLAHTQQDLERLGLVYATSLRLATETVYEDRPVAVAILEQLEPLIDRYGRHGFEDILSDYRCRCITLGRQVRVLQEGHEVEALAQDIAGDGSLICTAADGSTLIVRAGEASVRGLYGYV